MNILHISTHDRFGGAEVIMHALVGGANKAGHDARHAFAQQHDPLSCGVSIDPRKNGSAWLRARYCFSDYVRSCIPPKWKPWYKENLALALVQPVRAIRRFMGHEDFDHPVSRRLIELSGFIPDILHIHTLHGDFFDLRLLPEFSKRMKVIWTLHDEWAMTGHCAYTMDCDRWMKECGSCPYLDSYPAISRDSTTYNVRRKRELLKRSEICYVAPSHWLADRFKASYGEGQLPLDIRVIPNGVDRGVFCLGDKAETRRELGIPQDKTVLLFAAVNPTANRYKDFTTVQETLKRLKEAGMRDRIHLVVLGGDVNPSSACGFSYQSEFVKNNPARMAKFYQAADLYLHAARAENFPTVILEAMGCGLPVIATDVGGIREQVYPWNASEFNGKMISTERGVGPSGWLVGGGESERIARVVIEAIDNRQILEKMRENAHETVRLHYDETNMIEKYERMYLEKSIKIYNKNKTS